MSSLRHILLINDHIITKIVKSELVIRAVRNICRISLLLLRRGLSVNDDACFESHKGIYSAHLLAVAACEIVVDCYYMNAFSRECVKICGHGRNESLTLARFHLGDPSLMKNDTAHDLNTERTLAQHSVRRLSYCGKRVGQNIVKRFSARKPFFQYIGRRGKLGVGHICILVGKRFYLTHYFIDLFKLSFAVSSKEFGNKSHQVLRNLNNIILLYNILFIITIVFCKFFNFP